jgi:ABC-type phosphate transport system permease subunit
MVNERRKTPPFQLAADRLATWLFRFTGFGVILAVLGMLVFFLATVVPLFSPPQLSRLVKSDRADTDQLIAFRRDSVAPFLIEVRRSGGEWGGCRLYASAAPLLSAGLEPGALLSLPLEAVNGSPLRNLNELPSAEAASGSDTGAGRFLDAAWCRGVGPSLVLTAASAGAANAESDSSRTYNVSELTVAREFLDADRVAALPGSLVESLSERGWAIQGNVFYAQASKIAPVAVLTPSFKPVLTFTTTGDEEGRWVEDPGLEVTLQKGVEGRSLLLASSAQGDRSRLVTHLVWIQTKENRMTGQKSTEVVEAAFPPSAGLVSAELIGASQAVSFVHREGTIRLLAWDQAWDGGGDSSNWLASVDGKRVLTRSGMRSVRLAASFLAFGGNTLVALFLDGSCAGYDLAYAYLNPGLLSLAPRWEAFCHWPDEYPLAFAASPTQRLAVVLSASGGDRMVDLTTGDVVLERAFSKSGPGIQESLVGGTTLGFDAAGFVLSVVPPSGPSAYYQLDAEQLEGSVSRMFRRIHYEGYPEASFTWQSASGSDDFESKFSLWPLIWGTLKATLYAMAFAAPLGIFAAVYSSEILDRTTRNFVKPAIEMMASLPSVVLGFLAAVVLAPWIENNILGVLLCGLVLPFGLYFSGNLISRYSARHVSGRGLYASRRLLFLILGGILVSFVLLLQFGTLIEKLAFGRDFKAFLSGGPGSSSILYGILLLPLCLVGLWSIPMGRFVKTWKTVVFIFGPVLSMLIGAAIFNFVGDSGLVVGGYAQRNALVICIAMGFAIIPIIYSLSEDALTAVPGSLRAGSLACGASVWQTTAKVVLPTAASGIFSALMVGFGRAIGETMIVVMATGNSALMSLNPFEGLRTLAANIAVELPEAPKGASHYRILFFSGLVLFMLTFFLNTLAEALRTRYRKRNKAL